MSNVSLPSRALGSRVRHLALLFPEAWRRRRRRLRALGGVLALVIVVVLSWSLIPDGRSAPPPPASAPSSSSPRSFIAPSVEPAGWSVTYPVDMSSVYRGFGGIATDPETGDVWLYEAKILPKGVAATALVEWSSRTHQLTTFPLPARDSKFSGLAPMVVTSNGDVWVGVLGRLVVLDPATGVVRDVPLPPVRYGVWPATVAGALSDADPIDSLAGSGAATVVVAHHYASSLQLVNARTDQVTVLALPAGTAVSDADVSNVDVAIDAAGRDVAVVLVARRADTAANVRELGQFVQGRWSVSDVADQAWTVSFTHEELVVSNESGTVAVGTRSPGGGPVRLRTVPGTEGRSGFTGLALADSAVVIQSGTSVRVRSAAGLTTAFSFGRLSYVAAGGPAAITPGVCPPKPTQPCSVGFRPVQPEQMIWGGGDTVWFVPQNLNKIGLIAPR